MAFEERNAGNLNINARSIRLDNEAYLTADTQSIRTNVNQEQATITLRARDLILRGYARKGYTLSGLDSL